MKENHVLLNAVEARVGKKRIRFVSHEELKKETRSCKAVIRTGEIIPYANIILVSGVIFKVKVWSSRIFIIACAITGQNAVSALPFRRGGIGTSGMNAVFQAYIPLKQHLMLQTAIPD